MPTVSFFITILIGMLAALGPSSAFAGTVRVENRINTSVNTGGNHANGADGEDGEDGDEGRDGQDGLPAQAGADGKNGTIIEGKSQSSVSITTTVDGKVVEDFHHTVTDGKYATSSVTHYKDASVSTEVEMSAGTKSSSDTAQNSTALEDSTSSRADLGPAAALIAASSATSQASDGEGIGGWVRSIAVAITAFIHGLFG